MENFKTKTLTADEQRLLAENLDSLVCEYKDKGLVLEILVPIIGKPPIVPHSPFMDVMLEAYEARAEYGHKAQEIEKILSQKVASLNKSDNQIVYLLFTDGD